MELESNKLKLTEAFSLSEAEQMRQIRNECRDFMTQNSKLISWEQQKEWWRKIDRNSLVPLLAWLPDVATPIGYGIVRYNKSRWWLTGGLLNAYRGKGLGEQLFTKLIEKTGIPCYLEVRGDNIAARGLYTKLGFEEVGLTISSESKVTIITMRIK